MERKTTPRGTALARVFGLALIGVTLVPASLLAQENRESDTPTVPLLSTQQCADNWLAEQGLTLGHNIRDGGNSLIVARAEEQVQAKVGSNVWVSAREDAFNKARIQALAEIVRFFNEGIESGATLEVVQGGGAQLPEELQQTAEALSIADKLKRLTAVQLDEEIRKFIPDWNETDSAKEEKTTLLLRLQSRFEQTIKTHALGLLQGVTIGIQCEGPAEPDGTATSGKYAVSVTLVWSPKLAYLAQAMFNSTVKPWKGDNRVSIAERFATQGRQDPNWMSTTLGARVWTDENGEMVIVGFGAVPATSLKSADESRADLIARNFIAQFKAANLESKRAVGGGTLYREYDKPDSGEFSDASKFEERIEQIVPHMTLKGVYPVASWRGKHPVSTADMVVVARAWKPSAQADAEAASGLLKPGVEGEQGKGPASAIDSPVRSGVPVSTKDY